MMKYRLVLVAGILLCVSDEGVAKDSTGSQIRLDHLKVFSQDGSESLTAVCRPTHATEHKRSPEEVTYQFTHVRFQLPREEMRRSSDLCSVGSAQHFEARTKDLAPGWAGSSCRCAMSRNRASVNF